MGKQGELNENEIKFARARFFRYYHGRKVSAPPRIGLREWGFFIFGRDGMLRPIIFDSEEDLRDFLSLKVPRHAYYSSAYYRRPDKPMESPEKGWMGADLIFDLDADGLPGADRLSYEEQLVAVKEEIIRLYDIFLQEHLGFSDNELFLVFSGGRGYHIHIRTPRVLDMDGDERREIMDYVAGSFQDFRDIFPKRRIIKSRSVAMAYMLPNIEGGWGGMVRYSAIDLIERMKAMEYDEAIEFMRSAGIRRNTAERIYEHLFGERQGWKRMLEKDDLEVFRTESERDNFIKLIEFWVRKRYGVHPDIHVTQDTRRLIRLPFSLHGGTGFMVEPLKRDELEDFIPTRDAIPEIYGDEKLEIQMNEPLKITMKGEEYRLKNRVKVPEHVAMFLLLSGRGKLV